MSIAANALVNFFLKKTNMEFEKKNKNKQKMGLVLGYIY